MKIQLKKKQLIKLLKENSLIYIFCPTTEKFEIKFFSLNKIKKFKFKNTLLKKYNKNFFNGQIFLFFGENVFLKVKEIKNILGVFYLNFKKNISLLTFNKYLNIINYLNIYLKYYSFLNIARNNVLLWFLIKIII